MTYTTFEDELRMMSKAAKLALSDKMYRQAKEHRQAARDCQQLAWMLYADAFNPIDLPATGEHG